MGQSIRVNRSIRILALAAALAPAVLATDAMAGDHDVVVTNVPLPITGNVNAAVTGTVGISGVPNVRVALPAEPFFGEMTLLNGDQKAIGVPGRRLAVTSITISNFNSGTQQLFLFNPVMSSASCGGAITGGSFPLAHLLLEPFKSVQLLYPTPLVFEPIGGVGCIAGEVTTNEPGGSVVVGVTGFTVTP